MVEVRPALDSDVDAIREIFSATYGAGYLYQQYYDPLALKRLVFGDDSLLLVADDDNDGVLGTASVVLDSGAYTDLVGEFGRLAVHPDARGRGVGTQLMEARLALARERLHVAFMEARVVHPFSVRIAAKHGFAAVGFLPALLPFGDGRRESAGVLVQYFGQALSLRRNHPRMVPELHELADMALDNIGLPADVVIDETSPPYPPGGDFTIESLTTDGYSELLRIQRGRLRQREVFGRYRLHYGLFRLSSSHSRYLIARDGRRIAGGIGFTHEADEGNVRVFELIAAEEEAIRQLFEALIERCEQEWDVATIEIDVSGGAAAMQRTLIELGFRPAAYVPALAFHEVERIDLVRMMKILTPLDVGEMELDPAIEEAAHRVLEGFRRQEVLASAAEFLDSIALFRGLSPEQGRRLVSAFRRDCFEAGSEIFACGSEGDEMHVVLEGEVEVRAERGEQPLAVVGRGQCLGEIALLSDLPHSATAVARTDLRLGVLQRDALQRLVRRRPDIGVVLYRNLAVELGDKLRAANLARGPDAPGD